MREVEGGVVAVLARGDRVHESLLKLVTEKQISGGVISAIGAVKNTRIGFYHLHTKSYEERLITEDVELVNLSGNITWLNGKPFIHCHVTLGTTDFRALAGHLFEAECAVSVEIFIASRADKTQRVANPEIGLNLMELD